MTLVELTEFVGPRGAVKLAWNRREGWALFVLATNGGTWAGKTQDNDLDAFFGRCAEALRAGRRE